MEGEIPAALLGRCWRHSHEEDTEGRRVYRPAEHDLPPSRGRSGFELLQDGRMVEEGIAPADGPTEQAGRWRLEGGRRLVLESGSGRRVLELLSVEAEKLVVAWPPVPEAPAGEGPQRP